ncbi:alpha-glucosidase [Jannaschia marina]|uniref:alpha-glucosidase n=1 Tax=Jannaschia marina TaxID=2741674 RepID=UPI0015CE118A|nr:alpha-glucosidase [Jannaschia marina]
MTATATNAAPAAVPAPDLDWWRGGAIYQIYPRSFQDSTGDGIGDLAGIAERLPHVASLGVDAIWISPFFTSPMKDFGYDVSDYRGVDPMFGTLADFERLIEVAHGLGLRVMIDLVLSHSSIEHPWFTESRSSRTNPKADWYVWADPKPDGTPPNNWLSIFGGPAWHWDGKRHQYYLHNFLESQPDLNLHTPEVQEELLDITRFWLEKGVDGFRLDTINFYFADKHLRDNPALPPERRNANIAPSVNPYNHQEHIYSKNQPENLAFLKRFRALLDEYPGAAAVGEVGDAQLGMELLGQYTRAGQGVQMCYAFDFLAPERLTAARIVDVFHHLEHAAPDGWACWAFSNHDVTRHVTRWGLTPEGVRMYAALICALRGSVCFYQGEELGLTEADVAFEDLQDPYGIEFWPEYKGRDGCRTPMVWEPSNDTGGFSRAKPWLPVAPEHLSQSVAAQEGREDALLHHYRRVIAMRSAHPVLRKGDQAELTATGEVLSFLRTDGTERIFCAFNMGETAAEVALPLGAWHPIEGIGGTEPADETLRLDAWGYALLRAG